MKRILTLLILTALLLTACGGEEPRSGAQAVSSPVYNDTLKISAYDGVQSLDPAYARTQDEIAIANLVYDGLVKEEDGKIRPSLAKKWDISAGGLVYTFYLRDKVYFHNGKELTASDVRFSFERVLRQHLAGSYVFAAIVGSDQVLSGQSKELAGIAVLSDYTLEIRLTVADNNFLHYLAMPTAKVLDRLELVEEGIDFGRSSTLSQAYPLPSGTGPYRLAEWLGGRSLSLGSFANYYGEKPYPERIEYVFNVAEKDALLSLRAGALSLVTDAFSARDLLSEEKAAFIIISQPVRVFRYLAIDQAAGPFTNLQLRKAIFDAISAPAMIAKVRNGYGVYPGHDPAGFWYSLSGPGAPNEEAKVDLAKAELAAAGYPGGIGLPTLTLLCGPTEEDKAAAGFIADSLAARGVEISVVSLSDTDLNHRIRDGSAAFYLDEFADKGGGLEAFFKERVNPNLQSTIKAGAWSDPLSRAYSAGEEEKQALFAQVGQMLYDEGVLDCLYFNEAIVATTQAFGGLAVRDDGSLDFAAIVKNSREKE